MVMRCAVNQSIEAADGDKPAFLTAGSILRSAQQQCLQPSLSQTQQTYRQPTWRPPRAARVNVLPDAGTAISITLGGFSDFGDHVDVPRRPDRPLAHVTSCLPDRGQRGRRDDSQHRLHDSRRSAGYRATRQA
jgi:hypothetical protein